MRRFLVALGALLAAASTAQAASVTLQFDQAVYIPGDTGTLTITATADAGETDVAVYGELIFTSGSRLLNPVVTPTTLESFDGLVPWTLGLHPCNTSSCTVINQIVGSTPFPVTNTPLVIATVTFTVASPAGLDYFIDVTWQDDFDFFGAPEPAGACATVGFADDVPGAIGCPIPEPASGALLALGLLGFGAARHRRRA